MADRNIVVRFRAEVAGFRSAMAEATASTEGLRRGSEAAGNASVEASERAAAAAKLSADKQALAADKAALAQKAAAEQATAAHAKADAEAIKSAKMQSDMAGVGTKAQVEAYEKQSAAAVAAAKVAEDASAREVIASRQSAIAAETSATAQVRATEREATAEAARAASNATSMGQMIASADKHKQAWDKVGTTMIGVGATAAITLGAAIVLYAQFDSKMSQVKTLLHAGAADMADLTTAALTLGQGIGYSASDVADAEIELVKAGIGVKDIMGGALPGALALAAAGQIKVSDATEIATIAMTQFNLQGSDVPHVADLLAAGADKALGGVEDLGWALKSGGGVAAQFGISLEETIGTLSAFANAGLIGETAGTDLRQMLLKLADPSATAKDDMHKLGLSAYDAGGHFVGLTNLAGQLKDKLSGLTDADKNKYLSDIFGARSIKGANILLAQGADGIAEWTKKVNESGFAADQAIGKMDNLKGDVSKLKSTFESSMIEMGSSADSFLRPLVQNITGAIGQFEALPEPTKAMIGSITGVVAVTALAAGGFITLAPKVIDTVTAFRTLMTDSDKLSNGVKGVGIAAGVATVAMIGMSIAGATTLSGSAPTLTQMADSVMKLKNSATGGKVELDKMFSGYQTSALSQDARNFDGFADSIRVFTHEGFNDSFKKAMDPIMTGTGNAASGAKQVEDRIHSLGDVMGQFVSKGSANVAATSFQKLSTEFQKNGKSTQDALNAVPAYRDALIKQAHAAGETLGQQELLDYAMGKVPDSMAAAAGSTSSYIDTAGNFIQVTKDQQKALENVGIAADGTITELDKLVSVMEQAGLIHVSAKESELGFAEAIGGTKKSIDDNIKALQAKYQAQVDATKITHTGTDAAKLNAEETEKNKKAVDGMVKSHIAEAYSMDIKTEAGRKNLQSLYDIEKKGFDLAVKRAKDSTDEVQGEADVTKALQDTYDQLIANEGQLGITGTKAEDMARDLMKIPPNVSIKTWIKDEASKQLQNIGIQANNLNGKTATVTVNTVHKDYFQSVLEQIGIKPKVDPTLGTYGNGLGVLAPKKATGGPIQHLATGGGVNDLTSGGAIFGAGTKTSDSVPIWASTGEFMESAKAVDKYGLDFMHAVNNLTYDPAAGIASPVQYSAPSGGSSNGGLTEELKALVMQALARPQFQVTADKGINIQQLAKDIAEEFKWTGKFG